MSRLLEKISSDLLSAKSDVDRSVVMGRQACYFARIGKFTEAKLVVAELRQSFGSGQSGRVTIWIMIAEAMIGHYGTLTVDALDRIRRAVFLARLSKDSELISYAAAWKAHIDFDRSIYDDVFEDLELAIDHFRHCNLGANSRICNTICKIALLCGNKALAHRFFMEGRDYALREGDQAEIEALQHNRAAFRLARLRALACLEEVDEIELKDIRVEISTARSLQAIFDVKALEYYANLAEARFNIVEGKLDEAIMKLEQLANMGPFPQQSFTTELIKLELLYCKVASGRVTVVDDIPLMVQSEELTGYDFDEILVIRWMQREILRGAKFSRKHDSPDAYLHDAAKQYQMIIEGLSQRTQRVSSAYENAKRNSEI